MKNQLIVLFLVYCCQVTVAQTRHSLWPEMYRDQSWPAPDCLQSVFPELYLP